MENHRSFLSGIVFFALILTLNSSFSVTPMDKLIPEQTITEIECEYQGTPEDVKAIVAAIKETPKNGVYHYKVYLPSGYHENTDKKYPTLFLASSGGNAGLHGYIKKYVIEHKWIALMLVESRNGPWEPIIGNCAAAYDDAVLRFRVQQGMIYATGFSGGARVSSYIASFRPGFAGVILQGAGWGWGDKGYVYDSMGDKTFAVYAIIGSKDSNFKALVWLKEKLPKHIPLKTATFVGGHDPSPAEEMAKAFKWQEEQLLYHLPTVAGLKMQYERIFNEKVDEIMELEDGFPKYELIGKALAFAQKRALSGGDSVKSLSVLLKKLSKNKAVKNEMKAEKAYVKLEKQEASFRTKYKDSSLKKALVSLAKGYKSLAGRYKNTVYGSKAMEKFEELKKELE